MSSPARPAPPPAGPRTGRLLVDRTFGPWFWGNVVSNSGNWLFNVVAAVVVFQLSRSALLVGLVSVAQFVPSVVLAPITGAISDRLDRRRVLLWAQTGSALAAAALALVVVVLGVGGLPGAWPILLAAGGIGIGQAFAVTALNALVPALVDDTDLEAGVALTSLTFNLGRAAGPAASGLLLATVGAEVAFVVNALSFLPLLVALLLIRPRDTDLAAVPGDDRRADDRADAADPSARAGWRLVRRDRRVAAILLAVAAIGFAIDPVITLAPPLADVLGGDDVLVPAMVTGFGVAAIPGALLSSRLQHRFGGLPVGRAGALVVASGLSIAALAPTPAVAVAGFAVCGTGFVLTVTSVTTVLQRLIPDAVRGRVMALWSVAFLGSRPVAAVVDGAAADLVGPRPAMLVAIVVAVVAATVIGRLHARDRSHR